MRQSIRTSQNYFLFTGQALERSLLTHHAAHGLFLLGFPAACYMRHGQKESVYPSPLTTVHTLGMGSELPNI